MLYSRAILSAETFCKFVDFHNGVSRSVDGAAVGALACKPRQHCIGVSRSASISIHLKSAADALGPSAWDHRAEADPLPHSLLRK